jgi:hypothetical protein
MACSVEEAKEGQQVCSGRKSISLLVVPKEGLQELRLAQDSSRKSQLRTQAVRAEPTNQDRRLLAVKISQEYSHKEMAVVLQANQAKEETPRLHQRQAVACSLAREAQAPLRLPRSPPIRRPAACLAAPLQRSQPQGRTLQASQSQEASLTTRR